MRKTLFFGGIVIIAAVALIAAFMLGGPAQRTPLPQLREQTVTVSTSTITASTTEYTVDAPYPQFGIENIDSKIQQTVEGAANDLETQANQDKPKENQYPLYSFTSQFDKVYVGQDFITARMVLAQYTGGAHELPVIVGLNFHRDTGAEVSLDEALALTGKTLEQVATEAKQQLAQNPYTKPEGLWAAGSDPTTDNYKTFVITKNSVLFIFQPYQVAPYAVGAPEVSIFRVK